MKCVQLFTKDEIEKYGFIYEPDESKCKTGKCGTVYTTYYRIRGSASFKVYPPSFENNLGFTRDDFQQDVANRLYYKYVNSIFAHIPEDAECNNGVDESELSDFHAHVRVSFKGHTPFTEEEWKAHTERWLKYD